MLNMQSTLHIRLNCHRFKQLLQKHYQMSKLKDPFKNTKPEKIWAF